MNRYLVAAAILAFLVGLVHSILGERLIFRKLRSNGIVPTNGGALLLERNVRILWASWHLVTLFGWALAWVLWKLAGTDTAGAMRQALLWMVIAAMLSGSALVCGATKGRHPGWVGLLGVAGLAWLGSGGAL